MLQLAQDGALEEVQFQLYLKEIRRINPTLKEGNLFVDGLYELVCSRLPNRQESSLKKSVTDLLTVHSSKTLLLWKYWKRPDDQSEYGAYLAVSSSFVQYILSTYGPRGVSQFLRELDCSIVDPQAEDFSFKGKDITSLEFKWTKFAEAHVNEEFRLSTLGMLRLLFRKYLLRYWLSLAVILLIMLLDVGATLGLAVSIGRLITQGQVSSRSEPNITNETVLESHGDSVQFDLALLLQWTGIGIGLILFRFVIVTVTTGLQAHLAVCVCKTLRRGLSIRLHQVTPKFLSDYSASAILSTFLQDINMVEKLIAHSLRTVALGALSLLTFVLYTTALIWQLAIPLSVVYVVGQTLVWLLTAKFSEHSFAKSQATGKLCDIVKEQVDGYKINRLYGLAKFWKTQFDHVLHSQFSKKARRSLFLERFTFFCQLTVPGVISTLLTFSFILLLQFRFLTFESGLSIVIFFNYVVVHVVAAASDFPTLQTATLALQRINALLYNTAHSVSTPSYEQKVLKRTQNSLVNVTLTPICLAIELRDVCFSYNATASHWNLFDVSLKIHAGERVAIVGKSGCGKSTLLNIILQQYEPTHGEVVFSEDGFEYEGLKVAATFQFNHIFNMSIRENIRVGNLGASDEEVEEAARQADLHAWVSTLSRGYDTAVSSGGSSLSGGQKQRVAIARMLVARAPILVLDEVTSALDPATESRVFQKLMEVTRGKTVIAVTHRLEQAREFDRIMVLSHGKVKEHGSHDQLLSLKGAYWCMWSNTTEKCVEAAVPIIRRRGSVPTLHTPTATPPPTVGKVKEVSVNLSKSCPDITHESFNRDDLIEDPLPRITSTPRLQSRQQRKDTSIGSNVSNGSAARIDEHVSIAINDTSSEGDPRSANPAHPRPAPHFTPIRDHSRSSDVSSEGGSDEKWWSCDSELSHHHI